MKKLKASSNRFVTDLFIPKGGVVTLHAGKFNRVVVEGEILPGGGPDLSIESLELRDGAKIGITHMKAEKIIVPFAKRKAKPNA